MALIKCSGCGHMISSRAPKCPKCGMFVHKVDDSVRPVEKEEKTYANVKHGGTSHHWFKWLFVSIGIAAIIILVYVFIIPRIKSSGTSIPEESMENLFCDIATRQIVNNVQNKYNCFIVISKKEHSLKVYEAVGSDTLLISVFPACLSRNKGQKQGPGDMRTPESSMTNPFIICQIQDASRWKFDFGDGRGKIRAYGHWFLRLDTGFDGIGIQGSTNNESSVPGRDSSGSIRLKDEDLIYVKENYAYIGMRVIIKHEEEGLFGFEKKCIEQYLQKTTN